MSDHLSHRQPDSDISEALDRALLKLLSHNDQNALGKLYDRHGQLIYTLVFTILRDKMIAEEVTQDLFVKIWQKHELYDPTKGTVRSWFVMIARRLAIDRLRSREMKDRKRSTLSNSMETFETTPSYHAADNHHVGRALSSLEPPYKETLQLAYFDGFSHQMIADHLGIPLGTIKSRIRDGLIRLRSLYQQRLDREPVV